MEKSEVVYRTFKSRFGTVLLESDAGDFKSITIHDRVVVYKPGIIITAGAPADAVKRDGVAWFSFPHPVPKHKDYRLVQSAKMFLQALSSNNQEDYDKFVEDNHMFVEDHDPTTLTISIDLLRILYGGFPRSLLRISKEDLIPPKQVWFSFISRGGFRYLGRYIGAFLLVSQYDGIIVNQPGAAVAAVGRIPDELKIEGGISFSYPAPIYKFPQLPTTKLTKIDHEVRVEDMGKEFSCKALMKAYSDQIDHQVRVEDMGKELCCKALMKAYSQALGISSICKDETSSKEVDHMDELFPTSIVVNLATPQDIEKLNPSIWSVVAPYVPIKQETEEHEDAKRASEDGNGNEASIQAPRKRARL